MQPSASVMKIISSSLVGIALLCGAVGAKQKTGGDSRAAREIRSVLERQVEAWNRHDLKGFMKGYWQSPDLTFYSGATKTSGWNETLERYRASYKSEGREMGTLVFSDLRIEMLGRDGAFVRGSWHLKMSNNDTGGLFTLIFRRFADGWKIIHDHTGSSD